MANENWDAVPFTETFYEELPEQPGTRASMRAREPRWLQRTFPDRPGIVFWCFVLATAILVWLLRQMFRHPYLPATSLGVGIGWRLVASIIPVVLMAWVLGWMVARRSLRWRTFVGFVGLCVAVPTFLWAAMVATDPLAGPAGTKEDPAYLGTPFEIVVDEFADGTYGTVTGTVKSIQEVPLKAPPPHDGLYSDYEADGRCWAIEIEVASRFAPLPTSSHGGRSSAIVTADAWISTPDGTRHGSFHSNGHCATRGAGLPTTRDYSVASPATGVTTYSVWVFIGLGTLEEPSLVEVSVNFDDQTSFYLPELPPEACGNRKFCDGLLTLDDRAQLQSELADAESLYAWKKENCPSEEVPQACINY